MANDCAGDIVLTSNLIAGGLIQIGGSLKDTAKIEARTGCDGEIRIRKQTGKLTLIRLASLGVGAVVTVNYNRKGFHAWGTIHVECYPCGIPPNDVTFDGSIMTLPDAGGGSGGDLKGVIRVVGCHDPADQLDICICGDGYMSENQVDIDQDGCDPPLATWGCVTECP